KEVSLKEANDFFANTHIQGRYNKSCHSVALALVDDANEIHQVILACQFFGREETKSLEIVRAASKLNTVVVGGFSRIFKRIKEYARQEGYEKIISYSDCRYSTGKIYESNGFSNIRQSKASYDYTDWLTRMSRYKYRAKNGKSELDIVSALGLYKIYNAGTIRWELPLT
ncbi:hypothetical protein KA005_22305, partial [bacterium]|nr:hypothetical protein [bacterium]